MKEIDVIYSPLCEANGAFFGLLEQWTSNTDIKINYIPFNKITEKELSYYLNEGLLNERQELKSSIFIDVFYKGKLIDSVPLNQEKIESALDIKTKKSPKIETSNFNIPVFDFRGLLKDNKINFHLITKTNYLSEMTMCLDNYPHGNPPKEYHSRCINLKRKVFEEAFQTEKYAGIYATYLDKVIGILEVFPREIVKRYGFLTGNIGKDENYLTIGCYEIGNGIPRVEMIDELMVQLLQSSAHFSRRILEGIGVLEWNDGFTPYWVYDKYSFHRSREITSKKFVMERSI